MADIFVNYRSGDGQAAGRLNDQLEKEFDTFIDVKMEGGDSISAEISDALRNTQVFIAVLGKEWMQPANLERLLDEKDWIRRELLEVRRRKKNNHTPPFVVPVFVERCRIVELVGLAVDGEFDPEHPQSGHVFRVKIRYGARE